ncbi:MAG: TAXI family TRAP transporter solute-binding subunit [Betaproteobacteria bacterium]|jgi:hypothetical protein|nr:TAXI family TRAP transporter solute-binding subunit [Betaproteobacteria bacterium]
MKPLRILACSLVAPWLIGAAHAQMVGIMTTPVGSFSNSAGSAIAKVVNDKAGVKAVVQAQASTGFEAVEAGNVEFNLSNSFDATFFATGKGEYAGTGVKKNFLHAAALIPYRVAMHVRKDSDIKSIADLKGKRVASAFNAQKTIGRIIEAHLASAGLTYDDVVAVPVPNVVRQAEDFTSGKVDLLFFAVGSAPVKQAAASVGGLRVLPVDDSPEAVKRIQAVLPGAYILTVNPAPNIEGITAPTKLVAFDMVLNVNAKVPDDVVYKVVKAIHGNKKELVATFRPFGLFNPAKMGKPSLGVEFHPGAVKFYKEAGLWQQ